MGWRAQLGASIIFSTKSEWGSHDQERGSKPWERYQNFAPTSTARIRKHSMLCYRDQTFCTAFGDRCGNALCHRALTDEVREDAVNWWGAEGAPISVADLWDGCDFREPSRNPCRPD